MTPPFGAAECQCVEKGQRWIPGSSEPLQGVGNTATKASGPCRAILNCQVQKLSWGAALGQGRQCNTAVKSLAQGQAMQKNSSLVRRRKQIKKSPCERLHVRERWKGPRRNGFGPDKLPDPSSSPWRSQTPAALGLHKALLNPLGSLSQPK